MGNVGPALDDIDALLDEAERQINELEGEYEACLRLRHIRPRMRVLIKNALENQRSALDHLARLIVDECGTRGSQRVYYPLAQDETKFDAAIDSKMAGVAAARPDIKAVVRKFQPSTPGCTWLMNLNALVNENKHERLSPQTRQASLRLESRGPAGTVSWDPSAVTFGGAPGGAIFINGEMVNPAMQRTTSTIDVVYVAWLFDDLNAPVLGVLNEIHQNLTAAVDEIVVVAFP